MKRFLSMLLTVSSILLLAACNQNAAVEEPPIPPTHLELAGQWEQIESEFEGRHLGAVISTDAVELYWIFNDSNTRMLFWSGTFVEPETNEEPYSWISRNNTKKTELSLSASRDKTKEFTYDHSQISCPIVSGDNTYIVQMEKVKWAPDLKQNEFDEVEKFLFPTTGIVFSIPSYFEKNMENSTDSNTVFDLNMEGFKGVRLAFVEFPVSQQEYDEVKDEMIKSFFGEDGQMLSSKDIIMAGFPAQYFVYTSVDQNDITIYVYGALTYNVGERKMLIVLLSTVGSKDYTQYFDKIINDAELIKHVEPSNIPNSAPVSGIRPEFKEAMDSYEAFFDEYVSFMERYAKSDNPLSMFTEYANYMTKYAETMEALDQIDDESLSTEELAYYVEVQNRITQKLLNVAQ